MNLRLKIKTNLRLESVALKAKLACHTRILTRMLRYRPEPVTSLLIFPCVITHIDSTQTADRDTIVNKDHRTGDGCENNQQRGDRFSPMSVHVPLRERERNQPKLIKLSLLSWPLILKS